MVQYVIVYYNMLCYSILWYIISYYGISYYAIDQKVLMFIYLVVVSVVFLVYICV